MYEPASEETIEDIFRNRLNNIPLTEKEILQFKTAFLMFVGKEYYDLG